GGGEMRCGEAGVGAVDMKACLVAGERAFDERGVRLPVMMSMTVADLSGRSVSGHGPEAFWIAVQHAGALSVGMNCALGPKEMRPLIEELAGAAPIFISAHPNAGLPDPLLPTGFPETPESFAPQLREWAANGWLNIVGGCCGTTPAHIHAVAQAVREFTPRVLPKVPQYTRLAGQEPLVIRPDSNFTM